MSQGPQQTRLNFRPLILNRKTPSLKRHINSLPPELLLPIFACYCDLDHGPLPLLLVCRLWHTLVSDSSTLWGAICYFSGNDFYTSQPTEAQKSMREVPIFCYNWKKLQWAAKRAGTAPLCLYLDFIEGFDSHNHQAQDVLFLTRCRELFLQLPRRGRLAVAFPKNLPALEHLEFEVDESTETEKLIKGVEEGCPLLWSLTFYGDRFPTRLESPSPLLRRIRRLDIGFLPEVHAQFIMGLQNLRELTVRNPMKIPRLGFPKLVSLTIWDTEILVDENMEFPMLDSLVLHEDWSSLPRISAPKLTKLVLRSEKGPGAKTVSFLRQATVRPTSLVISDILSDAAILDLLAMWSGLRELHLKCVREAYILDQMALSSQAGSELRSILFPHLRYLTVHVNHVYRDPTVTNKLVQTLHTMLEGRKRRSDDELQRVTCVWEYWDDPNTRNVSELKEIEWVDVL